MSAKKPEKPPVITINSEWCKGCAICVEYCPQDVLALEKGIAVVVKLEECTSCQLCDYRCPDYAITVK